MVKILRSIFENWFRPNRSSVVPGTYAFLAEPEFWYGLDTQRVMHKPLPWFIIEPYKVRANLPPVNSEGGAAITSVDIIDCHTLTL